MKELPLTQGKVALVNNKDYSSLAQYRWCALRFGNGVYAGRRGPGNRLILLHRFLLFGNKKSRLEVHHRDGNGLNNMRRNLIACTHRDNLRGFQRARGRYSKFRGVSYDPRYGRWIARIRISVKKLISLGRFDYEIQAAKAYDRAARRFYGTFACPNFP